MSIKSLLFILFLYVCLVWVGAAYFYSGPELRQTGLLWTGAGLVALLLFLVAGRLMTWFKARRVSATAARPARKAAEPVPDDESTLQALIAAANATLRNMPGHPGTRGTTQLSSLPMYLLVGPQDSGKSATFLNSGLEPVPLAGQASNGPAAGPTRSCSFWLARNAIFVEIPGRLFASDSERWTRMLRILRGGAPASRWHALWGSGAPRAAALRGVIAFSNAREFSSATSDPERFEAYCKSFQERLRAIGEVFGSEFPVYQVIAKADSIPYFSDFFQRLPESDAGQVLGSTLPLLKAPAPGSGPVAEAEAQRLTASFRQLYHSLAERRMVHLAHEPDPLRRPAVYEFPRELKRIRTPLIQFLTEVFRSHPLAPGPTLRGFYFTAVREVEISDCADLQQPAWAGGNPSMESTKLFRAAEATQLFRAPDATQLFRSADLAKGLPAATPRRLVLRWAFTTDLFHSVILADRTAAIAPAGRHPFERERRFILAGICAACALLCLAFGTSWWRNRQLLSNVAAASEIAFQKHSGAATVADLRSLDSLRAEIAFLRGGAPLSYHWGLYSGGNLLAAARQVYFRNFQQLLLNDWNGELVASLRAASTTPDSGQQHDVVYRDLKAHLMITSGACKPEPALVAQVLKELRPRTAPAADAEWQQLTNRQADFYASELAYGNPCRLPEDSAASDSARNYLRRVNGIDRAYRAVLAAAEPGVPKPQHLVDLAPNYRQVLNGPADVPPVFTRGAWDGVRKASSEAGSGSLGESCVLGNSAEPGVFKLDSGIAGAVQRMYISEYMERWRHYVGGFSVSPYESSADAARKLGILSDHSSPLLALLVLTGNQTNFPAAADTGLLEKTPVLGSWVKNAAKAKHQAEAIAGREPIGPEQIARSFQPVYWVVPPGADVWIGDKNAAYIDALAQLGNSMQAIARGGAVPDPAVHQAAGQAYDKALEAARQISRGFRPAGVGGLDETVGRLLEEPVLLSKRFIISDMGQASANKTNSELRAFCAHARTTLRKYPFQPASADDASLEELTALFAPASGAIWKFETQSLADLAVKDGPQWKAKDPAKKPQIASGMLDFLNRAQAITNAFFPPGATQPQLVYSLRPRLDSSFKDTLVELELDGRTHQWTTSLRAQFSWPPPPGTREPGAVARLVAGPLGAAFASRGGLWGIFRIMADAEPRALGTRVVEWKSTRGAGGRLEPIRPAPVRLEIVDFPGGADLFNPKFFAGFDCPAKAVE